MSRFGIALERVEADTTPRRAGAGVLARAWRLTRVWLHLLRGALIVAVAFPFVGPGRRRAHVCEWSRALLEIVGARLHASGQPAREPVMIVANHVSWLDIYAINAVVPARFVAKNEVRDWPLIGWLAARTGTFFIRRGKRRDVARVLEQLERAMRDGDRVAVFPESTTTDGGSVQAFRPSLLQAVVRANGVLQPVALRYLRADGACCPEAAYCGATTLWQSLRAVVSRRGIHIELVFLPPLEARAQCRRELAREARELILRTLNPPARGSRAETRDHLPAAAR